jgi:hypothetical protein
MTLFEISLLITAVLASTSLCLNKLLKETHHSRCSDINLCFNCIRCTRNIPDIDIEEEETEEPVPTLRPTLITPNISDMSSENVSNLRKNYEK